MNEYCASTNTDELGVPEMVGALFGGAPGCTTSTENCGRLAEALPSLTETTIPGYVPTSARVGVPVKAPVPELIVSQFGSP